jgi:topoisomerase-4 subunit A
MARNPLRKLFEDNFLDYASYVIKDRAIPDSADGLKPVQRRILWSLHEMDDKRYSKVANVIGHSMKYHPHGDQSIGSALVALANRGYFVDRQGNFGNIFTGDDASAPRYIECRLTDLARDVLFNDLITEFLASYDGRNMEPLLLPAKLPVVLLLGAEGIAVGMSTRILPHNFCEVIQAQISCLGGGEFSLLPDFLQGGSIDATDYDDGRGRIRNRARIEKRESKKLVIRELPWGTTTESIMSSIESAARKGRLRISSINDFTAESVEIEITVARGASQDEALKQLYAHTDCEKTHTSSIVVIQDGNPTETTVSELIHYGTGRLVEILKLELRLELETLDNQLHWKTIEQIFIENRLYKEIEECTSAGDVKDTIVRSMEPFAEEIGREISPEDIDRLLAVRIRRISRFDIESHRAEMDDIRTDMKSARKNLRNITDYAIDFLDGVFSKYGKLYPRLTSLEEFTDIDVKKVSLRNLKVGFDSTNGFVGTALKGDSAFDASEYDRIIFFLGDGSYRVVPVQDKYFIDGDILYCGLYDRSTVFSAVYREPGEMIAYVKRFGIGGYIMDREYRFAPDGCEVLFFTHREGVRLEYWFQRAKRMRTRKGSTELSEMHVKGVGARGVRLCGKKVISSIKGMEQDFDADSEDSGSEPPEEVPPEWEEHAETVDESREPEDEQPGQTPEQTRTVEQILEDAEELRRKSARTLEEASGDLFDS